MMSLVTTGHATDPKVLVTNGGGSGENSADPLQTPRVLYPAVFIPTGDDEGINRLILEAASAPNSASIYFPSTAELMMPTAETIRRANPFDLSFGKANRIIGANRSILEQNGLVPATSTSGSIATSSVDTANACAAVEAAVSAASAASSTAAAAAATSNFLSKLQLPPALNHSPSIFSNIGLLGSATDGNENALKTADFARLVQQMKENGGLSAQNSFMDSGSSNAPKTADVLNAVLDIHMQSLQNKANEAAKGNSDAAAVSAASLQYLNSSIFNMHTPAGSAPNSAGVLASLTAPSAASIANVLASVAGGAGSQSLFVPPGTNQQTSPGRQAGELKLSPKVLFTDTASSLNGMHPSTSGVRPPSAPPTTTTLMTALQQAAGPQHKQSTTIDPAAWDPHDVKPIVSGSSVIYEHDPMLGGMHGGYHMDDMGGPRSNESGSSSTRNSSSGLMHHGHAGRGRGRSTAEMPPDERRQTILERNKAAAVRYRKRKKEEHDEMITRCQQMEQERSAIIAFQTQNAALRREVDRLTTILKERQMKCACLRGVTLPSELRERPPGDAEILEQCASGGFGGLHGPSMSAAGAVHLMNGLQHFNTGGGAAKRPHTMHKM
ncbi:atf-7 [Pristionchus pacificus]|uniref:BZIP domain-containing protein n=1 Tax=Pristionchus pacificus TaxID=54126 RepID=A0A8R1V324_PRIPA|nr:atf-7 [Pristionchus pacificus]